MERADWEWLIGLLVSIALAIWSKEKPRNRRKPSKRKRRQRGGGRGRKPPTFSHYIIYQKGAVKMNNRRMIGLAYLAAAISMTVVLPHTFDTFKAIITGFVYYEAIKRIIRG